MQKILKRIKSVPNAFTLAEVLITLGIIGVVAAVTIPVLITNIQSRIRSEEIRTAKYKFTKATDEMKSLDLIGPYASTEEFVNELKKHLKIAKICPSTSLEGCWPTKTVKLSNGEDYPISKAITGRQLRMTANSSRDYNSPNVGIVTADGTPMIISYNRKCEPLESEKTYTWTTEGDKPVSNASAGCVAAVMDINGSKSPNKFNEDVVPFNAGGLGLDCSMRIGQKCYTAPTGVTPLSIAECEQAKADGLGIKFCSYNNDFWAGAVKYCNGVSNMPTMSELAQVASAIYGASIGEQETFNGRYNLDIAKTFGMGNPYGSYVTIWSNQEYDGRGSYDRQYGSYNTYAYLNERYLGWLYVVCSAD